MPSPAASSTRLARNGPSPTITSIAFGAFAFANARNKSEGRFQGCSFAQYKMTTSLSEAPHEARVWRDPPQPISPATSRCPRRKASTSQIAARPNDRIKFRAPDDGTMTWSARPNSIGHNTRLTGFFHAFPSSGESVTVSVPNKNAVFEVLAAKYAIQNDALV